MKAEHKFRKTGIDIIGDIPWGTHLCQFYKTKEDLIDILVPYFKAGLENNEFCMWVTSKPLSEKEAKAALIKAVPNFNQYLKKGQIEIIPHTKWYLKDGAFNLKRVLNAWADKLNQALAKGYDGIRITGNTAWLEKGDWVNFADYEEEVNNTIGKHRMLAICTYGLDKCGASEIIDVISNHQFALIRREGKWELIESSERKKLEKDKRLLTEKVAKLTKKIPLTDNEKRILYGLIKYPLLNDQQLSEKTGIKRSTVTAIRNKLKKQGFYSIYIIPNFELLGCELICILTGKSPIESIEEAKKLGIMEKFINSPEIAFEMETDNDFLSIMVSKSFAEAKRLLDYISAVYDKYNIGILNPIYFPLATTKAVNFFDFSFLLRELFGLDAKEESENYTKPSEKGKRGLTGNEKIILYAITKYHDLNDTEIAKITKVSRQTVSQTRKRLLKENFLNAINIPDMKKLGLELLVLCHSKFDMNLEYISPPVWMAAGERESFGIFIFKNYTDYKTMHNKLNNIREKASMPEPVMSLFPIEQIKFQKMDFASIVKKIFDLKPGF